MPIYLKPLITILKSAMYFLIEFLISFPASFVSIILGSIWYIKIYVYVLLKYQLHNGRDSCLFSSLLKFHFLTHCLAFTQGPPLVIGSPQWSKNIKWKILETNNSLVLNCMPFWVAWRNLVPSLVNHPFVKHLLL